MRKGDVVWVEPELVAEIEFAEWTHDGRLRAPSYQGLREDKEADEVQRERAPIEPELRQGKRVLKLSNLDKPFWPEEGITKGDLLAYYRDVAPVLVPHLRDRPFTMKRYPDGWKGKFFFQKDAPKHMPDWIPTRAVRGVDARQAAAAAADRLPARQRRAGPALDGEHGLHRHEHLVLAGRQALAARLGPLRPRSLAGRRLPGGDPGRAAGQGDARRCSGSSASRRRAARTGSTSSCRSSGGTRTTETREFAEIVAGAIARAHPGLATTEWTKAKRRGVLIDTNQNGEGKTIASAYSVRPKPGAPVSTPLRWEEVDESLDPAAFTMEAVLERVAKEGDLFEGVLSSKQSLSAALKSLRSSARWRRYSPSRRGWPSIDELGDVAAEEAATSSSR